MKKSTGTRKLHSFAPGWSDPELLERTLVGRKKLVDRLEELAIDGAEGHNRHQQLIIGPRGSGKTHVIKVLHDRIWKNESIRKKLLVAYLIEDELGIASFLDFIVRVLKAVERWHPEMESLSKGIAHLYELSPDQMEEHAVDLLLKEAGERIILILAENLGVLFDDKQGFGLQGQKRLRDFVQQHPMIMIFATAQSLIGGVQKHKAPFFGFFSISHLQSLSLEKAGDFLSAMAEAYGKKDLMRFLKTPEGKGRIRAIFRFTGGNHRLLVTFFDFLTAESVTRLSEQFIEGLNPLRAYYQEQMRSLTAQQQKIVQYLSMEREPRIVKDIAKYCLASHNTVSKQLKELLDRRFVSRIPKGRLSYYEMAETLFRIIYEADLEQEGAPVRLFVDFLSNFYTAKELTFRRLGFSLLSRQDEVDGNTKFLHESLLYEHAIKERLTTEPDQISPHYGERLFEINEPSKFFDQLRKEKAYREIALFAPYFNRSNECSLLVSEAQAHLELGNVETAKERAELALYQNPDDPGALLVFSGVYSKEETPDEKAMEIIRRAYEKAPDDPESVKNLGIALGKLGNAKEALHLFNRLVELQPNLSDGWRLQGVAQMNLEKLDMAKKSLEKAMDLKPEDAEVMKMMGALHLKEGVLHDALPFFEKVTLLEPDYLEGWLFRGLALSDLGRNEEAQASYSRVLELEPDNAAALENLGIMLGNTGQHEDALAHFDKLTHVKPDYVEGWLLKASAQKNLDRKEEAQASYAKVLKLEPGNMEALVNLGIMHCNRDLHEDALEHLDRLTQVKPGYSEGWRLKGVALNNLGRNDEAQASYGRALELDPDNAAALEDLGVMLGNKGHHEDAFAHFDKLTHVIPDYAKGWLLKALAQKKLDRTDEAQVSYARVLELAPENAEALENLGIIFIDRGLYEDAIAHFEKLTQVKPHYSKGWRLMAFAQIELGKIKDAQILCTKALEVDPENTVIMATLGALLGDSGRHEEALFYFEKLTMLKPDDARGWFLKALALRNLGKIDEAQASCAKSLELEPTNTDSNKVLGFLYYEAGIFDKARHYLDRAFAYGERCPELFEIRGEILRVQGKYENAIEDYLHSLQLEPDRIWEKFNMASALLGLNRIEEAKVWQKRGFETVKKTGKVDLLTRSLHENTMALFMYANFDRFAEFLVSTLENVEQFGFLSEYNQCLGLAVFELLKKCEDIELKRMEAVVAAFEKMSGEKLDLRINIRFLQIGIDYFYNDKDEALLRMSREEREAFMEELGIESV